jgi:hypothetical protein
MDRSRGRTLAEIETIAEGAGIDVGAVRAALAAFETEELGSLARVVGGPTVFQLERTVPGTIRVEEMADLVSSACWALGIDTGEVTTHANGVRFYRKTEEGPSTEIELTRRQDQTRIRVRGRYDDPAGWTLIGGGITTGVTAGLAIATLDPSLLGIAGIIGGAAGAGWLGARAFWRRTSRRVRRRLAGLMDRLETQARSAAGARSEGSAASGQLRSGAESQGHRAGPAGSVVEPADDGD